MKKSPETAQDKAKQKQQAEAVQEQAMREREAEAKRLVGAFSRVSKTEDGRRIFRYLMNKCGFLNPSIVVGNEGNVLADSTIYNEARRNVYLDARQLIPAKELVKIEFNLEKRNADEDEED